MFLFSLYPWRSEDKSTGNTETHCVLRKFYLICVYDDLFFFLMGSWRFRLVSYAWVVLLDLK